MAVRGWLTRFMLLATLPAALAGQAIRGRVLDPLRAPIVGALVELRDSGGKSIQTTLTSPSGAFQLLAPAPGRYGYRVAAIGFRPRALAALDVPPAGVMVAAVVLERMIMRLPDLVAAGRRRYCGKSGLADEAFARLLESAHTALQIIETTIDSRRVGFQVAIVTTRTVYGGVNNIEVADTTLEPLT
ncbi:MAG: carboxypeptidase-like regulatory domain-containing protein, partial [Gemmatimonadales bacterium]